MVHDSRYRLSPRSFPRSMASYVLWLEHEQSRAETSSFYHLHKEGWYDRRLSCLANFMAMTGIAADEICMRLGDCRPLSRTEDVDVEAAVDSFSASVRRRTMETLSSHASAGAEGP